MWHFSSVRVMSGWPVTPTKCWLSVFCSFAMRFVKCVKKLLARLVCECDSRFVEIGGNVCKQRIAVLHDDGSIEALPLDGGAGRAYGEAVGLGRLLEPANEEAVACSLAVVAGIAYSYGCRCRLLKPFSPALFHFLLPFLLALLRVFQPIDGLFAALYCFHGFRYVLVDNAKIVVFPIFLRFQCDF